MDMNSNSVYGAGEGYPSTGGEDVVARASSASSSCDREPQLVVHLAAGDELATSVASSRHNTPTRGVGVSKPASANVGSTTKTRKGENPGPGTSRHRTEVLSSEVIDLEDWDDTASTSSRVSSASSRVSSISMVSSVNKRVHSPTERNEAAKRRASAKMPPPVSPAPSGTRRSLSSDRKKKTATVEERKLEMRDLLPSEIVAELVTASRSVEHTAMRSGNLKGTFVRTFKDAARLVEAGVKELERRGWQGSNMGTDGPASSSPDTVSDSTQSILWERMQAENRSLRNENAALRRELGDIKESLAAMREEMMTMKRSQAAGAVNGSASPSESRPVMVDEPMGVVPAIVPTPPPAPPRPSGMGDERLLLAKLSALMDAKMMAFREELGPLREGRTCAGAVTSASVGRKKTGSTASATTVTTPPTSSSAVAQPLQEEPEKKKKKKKKKKKDQGQANAMKATPAPTPASGAANAASSGQQETWSTVVGRKARKKAAKKETTPANKGEPADKKVKSGRTAPRVGAPPRTAAVTVTIPEGCATTYAEAIHKARSLVDITSLGVETVKWRKAVTGGLIMEIPGADGSAKADAIAAKMGEALRDLGVKVARPVKKAEFRLTGLEPSLTPGEIVAAVAKAGPCAPEQVRIGDIKFPQNGLGTVWVQCPVKAAQAIEKAKSVKMGWTLARVVVLATRPMQCFRCLALGHVRQRCTAEVDRSDHCYRCGSPSHKAAMCNSQPRCPVCAEAGKPHNHKAGSKSCSPPSKKKKGARGDDVVSPPSAKGVAERAELSQAPMEVDPIPDGSGENLSALPAVTRESSREGTLSGSK